MSTLTLAIPNDLKEEMDSLPELNWSEIARSAITKKITEYKLFKSIVLKSNLKEKDVLELGNKVSEGIYKEYKKRLK